MKKRHIIILLLLTSLFLPTILAQEEATIFCEGSGRHCVDKSLCSVGDYLEEYYCSGLSNICCTQPDLKSCNEMKGEICPYDKICSGIATKSSDTDSCCLAGCEEIKEERSECEQEFHGCYSECRYGYEKVDYSCNNNEVCCRTKMTDQSEEDILFKVKTYQIQNIIKSIISFIFNIFTLYLIILVCIIYIVRKKLKQKQEIKQLKEKIEKQKKEIELLKKQTEKPPAYDNKKK
jgi:cell division protein FtsL